MNRREKVFRLTKGRCYYCGCKLNIKDYQIDHFIPKSKGGGFVDNFVPACRDCNIIKSDYTIEEFRNIIENMIVDNITGRMISRYYVVKKKKIIFYFEKNDFGRV